MLAGRLDERVIERIVGESQGNPLALLELPHPSTHGALAGGFGVPAALPLPGRIEESFRERVDRLPPETQRLLLIAAAEPVGDPALPLARLERRSASASTRRRAEHDGLRSSRGRRSGSAPACALSRLGAASTAERQKVHGASPGDGFGRRPRPPRVAPRAHAAVEADEEVARSWSALRSRAQARGGLAAAAAFLEQSRTPDARSCARAGASAARRPGRSGRQEQPTPLSSSSPAAAGPVDELQRAGSSGCVGASPSCNGEAPTPPLSCSGPRNASSRSIRCSRSRRTSKHSRQGSPWVTSTPCGSRDCIQPRHGPPRPALSSC